MSSTLRAWKEHVAAGYRRLASPLGRHRLDRLVAAGLPSILETPLRGLFGGPAAPEEARVVEQVEAMRSAMAVRSFEAQVYAGAAGYRSLGASTLAHTSSVGSEWGLFLHRCARSARAQHILELGASAGFSGCYLASAPSCERFITIEASPPLAELARAHLGQVSDRAEVVQGFAEDVLDEVLASFGARVDFVYQDALKEPGALLACVDRLAPALSDGALLICDDIRWSAGCWEDWTILRCRPDVTTAVDVGRFGVCVWRGDSSALREADLSKALGWFRVHGGGG